MKQLSTLLLATLLGSVSFAQEITVLTTPPLDQRNTHYLSNRSPLQASPFAKLPIGAIQPGGWLKKQLELQADGLCGHLPEVSEYCKEEGNAWLSKDQKGHGEWEEVPYWLKGFVDLGNVLHDPRIQAESKKWIDSVLASQRPDGWFGPIANLKSTRREAEDTGKKALGLPDLWANALMLSAIRSYFEATQDSRIIPFMLKYYDWVLALPDKDYLVYWVDKRRGVEHLRNILWLYNATGEKRLLTLAEKAHRCGHDWTSGISRFHNVDFAECFIEPGLFSMLSKKKSDLDAVERNRSLIYDPYGQVPGGMFGGDEKMRPGYGDPRQAVETCGMVEMMQACEAMFTQVDGDIRWADRCEDVAFNSYPAALTADMKALRYLTAPNMVVSDHVSKKPDLDNAGAMFLMNPSSHRCCQHNHAQGWPYYAEHLWLATPDNGLCAMLYSQSSVSAKVADGQTVSIVEDSHYPFAETVSFKVATGNKPVKFPLYLRVPGWCAAAQLSLNGTQLKADAKPGQYIRLQREWKDGDRLELKLPMQIAIRTWANNKNSVSVDRGPLTYSLQIKERYETAPMASKKSKGGWPPMGKPGWPAFEIFPESPWNYGLVVGKGFQVVERPWPADDMPWTLAGAPVMITASAKLIPEWKLQKNNMIDLLMPSPVKSAEPLTEVTLLPMGACRLRLSAFPTIAESPAAPAQKSP